MLYHLSRDSKYDIQRIKLWYTMRKYVTIAITLICVCTMASTVSIVHNGTLLYTVPFILRQGKSMIQVTHIQHFIAFAYVSSQFN